MDEVIEVGDHVFVGQYGKVHWVVQNIVALKVSRRHHYAIISSPHSGRTTTAWIADLRLHSKATK